MKRTLFLATTALACALGGAQTAKVIDCVRDASLDYWAAQDSRFCHNVMADVFKMAGVEPDWQDFGDDHMMVSTNADVICSVFRNPDILANYEFPLQPLGRMHFALYTTPDRAMSMLSQKISDWPRMLVGYSPVSQGQNLDRQTYFKNARLSPEFVEIPTSAEAVDALRNGEIDALFLYTPFGMRPEGLTEIVPIGERNVYFAVRRDKPELLRRLSDAYREYYIENIDKIDRMRQEDLGIPLPRHRVRVAAYSRGDFFEVMDNGTHSGSLEQWMKTICGHTHWTLDYVYGDYDQSLADVRDGRLDIVAGLGFDSERRKDYLFPHTPIGMLRVYLWTHSGSPYKPGEPSTWKGMKVGILAKTLSGKRAKRQFDRESSGITYREFHTDRAMLDAYKSGEIDACIDVEMPELSHEVALHVYASHPMYVCTSTRRPDLFVELEKALEEICDDFPKYLRMISERHYGLRSEIAALSLKENEWIANRVKSGDPIYIDFSPWPFPIFDDDGNPTGFIKSFLAELTRKTRLHFLPMEQTDFESAAARFMRSDSLLWIPYPAADSYTYGATQVFSLPVPQMIATSLGAKDVYTDFSLFARPETPPELVSILRKVVAGLDPTHLQEMFLADYAERQVVHKVFGLTDHQLKTLLTKITLVVLSMVLIYTSVMVALLRKQTRLARESARVAENHAQAKTRFLAMMSHELRTPLNAVIGFSDFLSQGTEDEAKRKEYLDGIRMSSNALLELINDILDISKLEAGAMNMRVGTCDINKLLCELPAIFGYRVRNRGVKLRIDAPPQPVPCVGLSQQGVRQILINLVGNSAKFTERGEIAVAVRWNDDTRTLAVSVSDTGCGISDDKMSKLFDPFVQDIGTRMASSAGEIKGTGLGLPIVKRIVENAGGTITAKSRINEGTTFTITIPDLKVVEGAPKQSAKGSSDEMNLPERVLVVDDMTMNRKILGIHLMRLGVKDIRFAANGREALEKMDEWLPDLVLTDMWMPKMDGTELAQEMHVDRRLVRIPVVAVTADVDVDATYDMQLFAKVIAKPVTREKLEQLFHEV